MAKSRRPTSNRDRYEDDPPPVNRRALRRRPGNRNMLLVSLGILLALVLVAPMIIANTSYVQGLVNRILPLNGQIQVESTSLSWWSPVVLKNVTVTDARGEVVGKIAAVSGNRSLLSLVFSSNQLGTFSLAHPVVYVELQDSKSNLEELIEPILSQPASSPKSLEIVVSDGVVNLSDLSRREKYVFNNLEADIKSHQGTAPLAIDIAGVMPTKTDAAKFKVAYENGGPGVGSAQLTLDGLPLPMIEPLLRRQLAGAQLDGDLHARLSGNWGQGRDRAEGEITGQLELHDVALTANAIQGDQIQLSRVRVPVHLLQNGSHVDIDKLSCESDIGDLTATGQLELYGLSASEILASLTRQPCRIEGELDLAKIAQMLPKTLATRQDTELVSGRAKLDVASTSARDQLTIHGTLATDNLTARTSGRTITWRQPISATLDAHQADAGLVVDHLQCDSSFLSLDAMGRPERGRADLNYDLSKLVSELSRFFDLGSLQLAGRGKGQIDWKTDDRGRFAIDGELNTRDFQFVTEQRRAWSEPQLVALISGQGEFRQGAMRQLDDLSITFDAGDERLKLTLREPADLDKTKVWPLSVRWQGDLAQWLPRIEPWFPLRGYDILGNADVRANVDYSPQQVDIRAIKIVAQKLRIVGGGWYINEPQAELNAELVADPRSGEADVNALTFIAGESSAKARNFRLRRDRGGWQATGEGQLLADLAQFAAWRRDPRAAATTDLSGRLDCQTSLTMADSVVQGVIEGHVTNLQMVDLRVARQGSGDAGVWRERQLELRAKGKYDPARAEMRLDLANIVADALELNMAGKFASGRQQDDVDFSGKISYDWQRLAPLWQQYLGPQFQFAGRESRDFVLRGRVAHGTHNLADMLTDLQAQVGVGWEQAIAYGIPLGRTDLNVQLDRGKLQVSPLSVDVSGGKLTFAPQFLLTEQPARMTLAKGPVLSRIQLTPDICKRGLKFVNPLIAETTVANGEFTVNLLGASIPLSDPAAGEADGNVLINAQVKPGPIIESLATIVGDIEKLAQAKLGDSNDFTLLKLDQGNIQFRMVDRKVYHQGVKMNLGPALLTTRGYVGLDDDALNVLAVLELPEAWQSKRPILGKIFPNLQVQIPITGTTSQPKLDVNVVRNLIAQGVQNATQGAILEKVQEGIGKALPGLSPADPNNPPSEKPLQDVLQGFRNLLPPGR